MYYVNPAGQILKITDRMGRPNGVQLSQDEKVLYVADPIGEHVMAFDVQPDGTVRNQREFAGLEGVIRSETGVTSGADGIAGTSGTAGTAGAAPAGTRGTAGAAPAGTRGAVPAGGRDAA